MLLADHITELAQQSGVTHVLGGTKHVVVPTPGQASALIKHWSQSAGGLAPHTPAPTPTPPPPPSLSQLDLDTGYIAFDNGVAVGGSSLLTLLPNGAFSFSGHFHDSGGASYDMSYVAIVATGNSAITFEQGGRVHGTFEAGSRDWDWGISGNNPALTDLWESISSSYYWHWNAAANADIGQLITLGLTSLAAAIGIAIGSINIIKAVK